MTKRPEWGTGDGSGARGLGGPSRAPTSWRQTFLIPPEQITIRLDLGWDRTHRVGMFSAEAYVPGSHELLALEVHPTKRYEGFHAWLDQAQAYQTAIVREVMDPDPFP